MTCEGVMPAHAAPVGTQLPPDYFSPGTQVINGQVIGSLWAIAFYQGGRFRYERVALGEPWVRTE